MWIYMPTTIRHTSHLIHNPFYESCYFCDQKPFSAFAVCSCILFRAPKPQRYLLLSNVILKMLFRRSMSMSFSICSHMRVISYCRLIIPFSKRYKLTKLFTEINKYNFCVYVQFAFSSWLVELIELVSDERVFPIENERMRGNKRVLCRACSNIVSMIIFWMKLENNMQHHNFDNTRKHPNTQWNV